MVRIGTAGWSIPRQWRAAVESSLNTADREALRPRAGHPRPPSHLETYAACFTAVEINSSFYRHHRRATYERWAASVPTDFRFAVKLPRTITHDQALVAFDAPLDVFLEEIAGLGTRLGPLLAQLPPSLQFDAESAESFFAGVRALHDGEIVCEPRHPSWFAPPAEALLERYRVARVAADPACVPEAALPGGWPELVYARLHGSPQMYRSPYSAEYLERLATMLVRTRATAASWCIFDNTTLGEATGDALALLKSHLPRAISELSLNK